MHCRRSSPLIRRVLRGAQPSAIGDLLSLDWDETDAVVIASEEHG